MINKSHVAPACEPITRLYLRSGEIRNSSPGKKSRRRVFDTEHDKKIYCRSVLSPSFNIGSSKTEK